MGNGMSELSRQLRDRIRTIPGFPRPGILFKDLTPVFADPDLLARSITAIGDVFPPRGYDAVGGIEARGFILGALVAQAARRPFFPFRKAGKLPAKTIRESYALEYGESAIEMHADALAAGARVLVVDDLLATGGTAAAAVRLARRAGGSVAGVVFLVELTFLDGRAQLIAEGVAPEEILSLVSYAAGE